MVTRASGRNVGRRGAITRGATICIVGGALAWAGFGAAPGDEPLAIAVPEYVVIAYNDLGMHCMQRDFSSFLILPPYNNIGAVVIKRGNNPDIVSEGGSDFALDYTIPSNTHSADKTNWWTHEQALLGVTHPPDVGLTGNGMSGNLQPDADGRWYVTGIPITPLNDMGMDEPYPLATLTLRSQGSVVAKTQTVVPVSWEISCNICHTVPGVSVELDILRDHDRMHGTTLEASQPVFCAGCHADPALGAPGQPGISSFSSAMHTAHATRLHLLPSDFDNSCYACHPGQRAQCQRDVHFANGVNCVDCHGSMADVGAPTRTPWVDEPRCVTCHARPGFEFEQPGTLYRNSFGHGGVACFACHGSPHAQTPAVTERDNLQTIRLQGAAGPLSQCTVCHTVQPGSAFFHRVEN
jgi:hypothetical protein